MAGGILREPAAQHPHFLGEDFMDAPEAGEGGRADDGRKDDPLYEERPGCKIPIIDDYTARFIIFWDCRPLAEALPLPL